jgi:uncharacterized membrane protein
MKKHIILLLIMGIFSMNSSFTRASSFETAPSVSSKDDMPSELERIELHGDLMLNVGPNAIEAGANDDVVYIQFNQSFGNVSIAIFNSNRQQVYSTVVDTYIQQVVIVPFSFAVADAYTVTLNHADNYAEGDFEKN